MREREVEVFFYGSYINRTVLKEVDIVPAQVSTVRLPGFDIRIEPLANLIRSSERTVYGILAAATHSELERLYSHARDVLGGVYLPEAVVVYDENEGMIPALCYIATHMEEAPADAAYVDRITGPAREYGFPDWYIERLESFRT